VKCNRPICDRPLSLLGAGWLLLALFVGETGLLAVLPRVAPPVILGCLTALLLGAYFLRSAFRREVDLLSDRQLVAIHLTRYVGVYLLILGSRGELEADFAVFAGWGDIAIATGAFLLVTFPAPRWVMAIWNIVGFTQMLLVVARSTSLRLSDADSLAEFERLPLSFLPTMLVPIILAAHVILFLRLLRRPMIDRETDQSDVLSLREESGRG